jgi:P-type Cu+ transporter
MCRKLFLLKNDNETACYHCGEDCGKNPVMYDDKPFCCSGCSFVYEILKEGEACEYYDLEKNPGLKIEKKEIGNKFAYLDNTEIKEQLLSFSDGGISKVSFFVPGIHCSSCIWLLENLNRLNPGIIQSNVNFVKKEVKITFKENEISLREIFELLVAINYIPQINLSETDGQVSKSKTNKKLYYKIGVAGFCFGNIMLLSLPEYFSRSGSLEQEYRQIFSWINLLLSLPVLFYADTDYLISAYKGLKKKSSTSMCRLPWAFLSFLAAAFTKSLAKQAQATWIHFPDWSFSF